MRLKRVRRGLLAAGLVVLAASMVFLAVRWGRMPDEIPTHFNAAGQIDGWGDKATVLLLPVFIGGLALPLGGSILCAVLPARKCG